MLPRAAISQTLTKLFTILRERHSSSSLHQRPNILPYIAYPQTLSEAEANMSSFPTGCCSVHYTGVGWMFTMEETGLQTLLPINELNYQVLPPLPEFVYIEVRATTLKSGFTYLKSCFPEKYHFLRKCHKKNGRTKQTYI